jgi:hypothetical protein
MLRVRYLTCRRCGLRVKSEERLSVPWDNGDCMALVAQVFPEDAVVDVATLQIQDIIGEGMSRLNAHLIPYGWQLELVRNQGQVVGVMRRRMSTEAQRGINGELDKRRERRHGKGGG